MVGNIKIYIYILVIRTKRDRRRRGLCPTILFAFAFRTTYYFIALNLGDFVCFIVFYLILCFIAFFGGMTALLLGFYIM